MLKRTTLAATMIASTIVTAHAQGVGSSTGAVFAATDSAAGNEIIMYSRNANGGLRLVGRFPTGGRGEGGINDPLQADYSVTLDPNHAFLLVANAGSSDISVFRVLPDGLALASVTPSGGGNPVSIAVHGNLVYVVNTGGNTHTAGFQLEASGGLKPVKNSIAPLSSLDSGASTAAFTPDGTRLVVSERLTSKIDVFSVGADGSLSKPVFNASAGAEPFGVAFSPDGSLLVTEATFGQGTSSTSSYTVNADNTLTAITRTAASSGGAACWIAVNGRYAWVSNTGSSDIGAYSVGQDGSLQALGVAATLPATEPTVFPDITPPTSFPIDLALTGDSQYLYVAYSGTGQIVGYKIEPNGLLTQVTAVKAEKPQIGAEGLAVY